ADLFFEANAGGLCRWPAGRMDAVYRFALLFLMMNTTSSQADVPALFKGRAFTCATLAEVVNHYVALGEDAAVKELKALVPKGFSGFKRGFSMDERIGWVCRILFEPKGTEPLRPPGLGGLSLPPMPLKEWPFYPVARSGETYCVLSEGYMLA